MKLQKKCIEPSTVSRLVNIAVHFLTIESADSWKLRLWWHVSESNEKQWKLLNGMAENPFKLPYRAALSSQAVYLGNFRGKS